MVLSTVLHRCTCRCKMLLHVWPKNPLARLLSQPWDGDVTFTLPPDGEGAERRSNPQLRCSGQQMHTSSTCHAGQLPALHQPATHTCFPLLLSRAPPAVFPAHQSAKNFTVDDIWQAMQEGRRAVWAKLPAIQASAAARPQKSPRRTTQAARPLSPIAKLDLPVPVLLPLAGGVRGGDDGG